MLVYNITFKVNNSIAQDWLKWQKEEYIPMVMSTNLFSGFNLYHLLHQDETDGITYVVQFFTDALFNYENYLKDHANVHREIAQKKWSTDFISFESALKSVQ